MINDFYFPVTVALSLGLCFLIYSFCLLTNSTHSQELLNHVTTTPYHDVLWPDYMQVNREKSSILIRGTKWLAKATSEITVKFFVSVSVLDSEISRKVSSKRWDYVTKVLFKRKFKNIVKYC